jgi:hypothetical protein
MKINKINKINKSNKNSKILTFIFILIIIIILLFVYAYNSGSCKINKKYICDNNFCLYKEFDIILGKNIKNDIDKLGHSIYDCGNFFYENSKYRDLLIERLFKNANR